MKKTVLALVTLLLTVNSFAIASCPTDSCPIASWPDTCQFILSNENVTDDDGWILVGEVRLHYWRNAEGDLIADLYIREVAHKIIYRIQYNGKFYAVTKDDREDTKYWVNVDQKSYFFNVQ
jgi:hypothetical protein